MLVADTISVSYDGAAVLSDISLEISAGSLVMLLGPNGAGKTTFLKALNGTVPLARGTVRLDNSAITRLSRRQIAQGIAVVAQENETRFPITVMEFVLSGRFVHGGHFGWESEADIRHARTALLDCDLAGFEDRLMNHLSGGERQRVVLARALATEARLLLLDEPTANLDLSHQALMLKLVRTRCHGHNASAVVITHDLNLASEFADEVLLLHNGKAFAHGLPHDVLTAEKIGSVFDVSVLTDTNPSTGNVRVTNVY